MEAEDASQHSPKPPAPVTSAYLAAKKTVDDRALNRHVVDALRREVASIGSPRVLEVGAGIGTMVARLADWNVVQRAEYVLLDADPESLAAAPRWLSEWAVAAGRSATLDHASVLTIVGGSPALDLRVSTVCADVETFLRRRGGPQFDLLVANAFLDLVDVPATLPVLLERLTARGIYWFSINFDGETIFLPEHPADAALMAVYHRSMDQRSRAGDSRTGRHLFQQLPAAGARILASGSSDWVVHAVDGRYSADEAQFVAHILDTIEAELNWRREIDQAVLRAWLQTRREQLARGELVYIAHQLDFLGRRAQLR